MKKAGRLAALAQDLELAQVRKSLQLPGGVLVDILARADGNHRIYLKGGLVLADGRLYDENTAYFFLGTDEQATPLRQAGAYTGVTEHDEAAAAPEWWNLWTDTIAWIASDGGEPPTYTLHVRRGELADDSVEVPGTGAIGTPSSWGPQFGDYDTVWPHNAARAVLENDGGVVYAVFEETLGFRAYEVTETGGPPADSTTLTDLSVPSDVIDDFYAAALSGHSVNTTYLAGYKVPVFTYDNGTAVVDYILARPSDDPTSANPTQTNAMMIGMCAASYDFHAQRPLLAVALPHVASVENVGAWDEGLVDVTYRLYQLNAARDGWTLLHEFTETEVYRVQFTHNTAEVFAPLQLAITDTRVVENYGGMEGATPVHISRRGKRGSQEVYLDDTRVDDAVSTTGGSNKTILALGSDRGFVLFQDSNTTTDTLHWCHPTAWTAVDLALHFGFSLSPDGHQLWLNGDAIPPDGFYVDGSEVTLPTAEFPPTQAYAAGVHEIRAVYAWSEVRPNAFKALVRYSTRSVVTPATEEEPESTSYFWNEKTALIRWNADTSQFDIVELYSDSDAEEDLPTGGTGADPFAASDADLVQDEFLLGDSSVV